MCILELSKVSTYEFCYDYTKIKCGNNSKLLFTGTDGLMYEMEDVYEVVTNIKMFCWIKNIWDIQWIGFKVKIIKLKLFKSTKLLFLVLMIKHTSRTMDVID